MGLFNKKPKEKNEIENNLIDIRVSSILLWSF